MTGRTLALGAAVWMVLATVVGVFLGRCLKLMEDDDDR